MAVMLFKQYGPKWKDDARNNAMNLLFDSLGALARRVDASGLVKSKKETRASKRD